MSRSLPKGRARIAREAPCVNCLQFGCICVPGIASEYRVIKFSLSISRPAGQHWTGKLFFARNEQKILSVVKNVENKALINVSIILVFTIYTKATTVFVVDILPRLHACSLTFYQYEKKNLTAGIWNYSQHCNSVSYYVYGLILMIFYCTMGEQH